MDVDIEDGGETDDLEVLCSIPSSFFFNFLYYFLFFFLRDSSGFLRIVARFLDFNTSSWNIQHGLRAIRFHFFQ